MSSDSTWIKRYFAYSVIRHVARGNRYNRKPKASQGDDNYGLFIFLALFLGLPLWGLEWCSRGTILAPFFLYMLFLLAAFCLVGFVKVHHERRN